MKLGDVIALLKAGYNKEEINTMLSQEPETEAPAEGSTAQEPEAPQYVSMEMYNALQQKFDDLEKTIQNTNIIFSQQPVSPSPEKDETVEDILKTAFL